jgi:hypothetical protein
MAGWLAELIGSPSIAGGWHKKPSILSPQILALVKKLSILMIKKK